MDFGKEKLLLRVKIYCHLLLWNIILLRGLFGVSSTRPVEQRVAPQPTEPTENVYFEIPSGMIQKLLANPFAGDGTLHPDLPLSMWMKFVDYLSLLVFLMMLSKGRSSLYLLREMH